MESLEDKTNILNKYSNFVTVPYKTDLADTKLADLLNELTKTIEILSLEYYYQI